MMDMEQYDGIYDKKPTKSTGGCCGCLIFILAAIGFLYVIGICS